MKAILMSGPAGSGKSTWAGQYIQKRSELYAGSDSYKGMFLISSDATRYNLFGKYWLEPKDEKQVIPEMMRLVKQASENGSDIIIDVAVCKNKGRMKWYNRLRQYYKDIELVIIDIPLELALQQNQMRPRHVPEETIREMFSFMEEPTDEMRKCFSKITTYTRRGLVSDFVEKR